MRISRLTPKHDLKHPDRDVGGWTPKTRSDRVWEPYVAVNP